MTIEERAFEATKDHPLSNIARKHYILGATEQHKIDIEKARDWLLDNVFGREDCITEFWVVEFCKAMEE